VAPQLAVVGTSRRYYLNNRHACDISFVLKSIPGTVLAHLTAVHVIDIGEGKPYNVPINNDAVVGQAAVYGLELGESRQVDGAVTVLVLNPLGFRFVKTTYTAGTIPEVECSADLLWGTDSGLEVMVGFLQAAAGRASATKDLFDLLGDYLPLDRLGQGASATVYRACHRSNDPGNSKSHVVIKVFPPGRGLPEVAAAARARRQYRETEPSDASCSHFVLLITNSVGTQVVCVSSRLLSCL
jgi:hypothetical protein